MAKDPAFLFYSSDFLTGISDLTMEERGQYITLLCIQHQKGRLSEKIIKITLGNISEDVLKKFTKDENGLYYNERLELEAKKRAEHGEKQRQRALKGWEKRKATADATALPLEDRNEIEDESLNETREKLFKPDFENFISACFKYLGKPYTQGNPEMHGIESPIRKWLLTHDANTQLRNLNAYVTVTPDKQFRAKTIEKLLDKLEGYNFCQDLKTYSPSTNGQQQKSQEQLDSEKEEERLIRVSYAESIEANEKAREEQESDGDFEQFKSDIGK